MATAICACRRSRHPDPRLTPGPLPMTFDDSTPLRRLPDFVSFWLARLLTTSAFQVLSVAIGWQVYSLTHNVFDLGLVGLIQFLPRIALVLVIGHVADRYDRRRVVGIAQLLQALSALSLAHGVFSGGLTREWVFLAAFIMGAARAFEQPTSQALLPMLLPTAVLPRAIAANASANELATIVAPALGGFLYAIGPGEVYLLGGGCYLLACVLNQLLRPRPTTAAPAQAASLDTFLAGIRFIRSRPDILGAISLDMFAVLLGGATALLPVFARDILHAGPMGLGLLRSAPGIGALLMSLWLARHPPRHRVGRVMFMAVAVFGLSTIVFGLSSSFPLSLAALVVLGASDMISVVIRSAFIQLETPDEMRGRVSAVNMLFIGASNQLGEFESGATAALVGTVPSVVIGGAGTLLVVVLWMRLFPSLAKREQLVTQAH